MLMASKSFAENPIGVDFEVEDLIKMLKSGVEEKIIKKRCDIGPRGLETVLEPPAIIV